MSKYRIPVLSISIRFRSAVSYKTKAFCNCVNECVCVKKIIWISFFLYGTLLLLNIDIDTLLLLNGHT